FKKLAKSLDVPVGIINSAWGGSRVEGWLPAEVLKTYPGEPYTEEDIKKQQPTLYLRSEIMYNGVLHPVIGYTVKGFIWYQGCSNVSSYTTYADRFAQLIQLWRQWWGQGELPFYYVEVAPYNYGEGEDVGAMLREAQYEAQFMVPRAAMVCTNDLVSPWEVNQIHPKNKLDVGRRLSYLALNDTYGMKAVECRGPEFKSMEVKDGKAILTFDYARDGFNRLQGIEGFEICGADKRFVKADAVATWTDRPILIVSSPEVPQPVAVRYAFHNFSPGNLASAYNLPVVPFRTDK
ncbi:MAG: sialate O-acetylesterase, partial [Bacteroidaceae bacterium]|nr:sialate O-acetylesterase [Bacteroidaceae bacterium]